MKYFLMVLLLSCWTGSACAQKTSAKDQGPKTEERESGIIMIDLIGQGKESDGRLYLVENKYYIAESMPQVLGKLDIDMNKDIASVNVNPMEGLKLDSPAVVNAIPTKYQAIVKGLITITLKSKAKP